MKLILTESQYKNLITVFINEGGYSEGDPLEKYLRSKPELIPLYKKIEDRLQDKFTEDHFENEIKYSGGLKEENGGLTNKMIQKFNLMLKENGLLNVVSYHPQSYRDYNLQKEIFITQALKKGGKIADGLRQAALPGFSQHHTGNTLDFSPSKSLSDETLNRYGFMRPYKVDTGFRMAEPWHIVFKN